MNNQSEYNQTGSPLPVCISCSRTLTRDEVALTKKLINRGAKEFLCLSCLARHFDVPEDALKEKILQFRRMGCTLFP